MPMRTVLGFVAYVADTGAGKPTILKGAQGKVYSVNDVGLTTPLACRDIATEKVIPNPVSNDVGFIAPFKVSISDTASGILWVSGEYPVYQPFLGVNGEQGGGGISQADMEAATTAAKNAAITDAENKYGDIPAKVAAINPAEDSSWRVRDTDGTVALAVDAEGSTIIGDARHRTGAGWRIADSAGRVAIEVDGQGRTHIHDLVGGGPGGGSTTTETHVFLAAGQSNMKGHAQPHGGELDPPDPRIMEYGATEKTISVAGVPLDNPGGKTGLSPATVFAREYLKTQPANVSILIVPAAWGGTGFNDGSGNGATWDDRQSGAGVVDLYGDSVTQTNDALEAAGATATLRGIIWHQGESDQNSTAAAYEEQLDRLVGKYRSDFGDTKLPFIVGQMTPEGMVVTPRKADIDAVHQATPARLKRSGFAPATPGGTNYSDTTHFGRIGVETLGLSFVEAYYRALANESGLGPQQPQNVQASFIQGDLTITWEQQPRRVTSYRAEYRIDGGAWVEASREYPMNLAETITGLTGTAAEARVTCINDGLETTQFFPTLAPHINY